MGNNLSSKSCNVTPIPEIPSADSILGNILRKRGQQESERDSQIIFARISYLQFNLRRLQYELNKTITTFGSYRITTSPSDPLASLTFNENLNNERRKIRLEVGRELEQMLTQKGYQTLLNTNTDIVLQSSIPEKKDKLEPYSNDNTEFGLPGYEPKLD